MLCDLAADLRKIDSDMVRQMALLEAARWRDHSDYRPEWRV